MKCPVCGNEIKDEQLYCEYCGYEIRIVPDFEPEIENNIQETMSGVVNEFAPSGEWNGDDKSISQADGGEEEEMPWYAGEERPSLFIGMFHFFKKRKLASAVILAALAVVIASSVIAAFRKAQRNTYAYRYEQGIRAAGRGDYEQAIECMKQALQYDNQQGEARMLTADYYVRLGNLDDALSLYLDLISYEEFRQEAYEKVVGIYEEQERFTDICNLMERCEDEEIRRTYNEYLAEEPIFSISGGIYEDAQMLKISANTNGIIYYTLDGSTPGEADLVYTGPILLESGVYRVNAVFINEYGMMSQLHTEIYEIEAELPSEPVVTPAGGDYTEPQYISVEIPQGCRVYYTTDGSVPDNNSTVYSKDICMPLGVSNYSFISYNEDHVASEVIRVEYHLNLDQPRFSAYEAMLITTSGLTERGILLNMNGEVAGAKGIYSYQANAAFVYNGEVYYLVSEYYTDESGSTYASQTKYAVSVAYGVLYRTGIDADGHFTAISFE